MSETPVTGNVWVEEWYELQFSLKGEEDWYKQEGDFSFPEEARKKGKGLISRSERWATQYELRIVKRVITETEIERL